MRATIKAWLLSAMIVAAATPAAHAQGMLLDYAADQVIQKYQTSTCDQLKALKATPPSLKEREAIEYLRNDAQARQFFIDRIAAPVANKMFECGMFP